MSRVSASPGFEGRWQVKKLAEASNEGGVKGVTDTDVLREERNEREVCEDPEPTQPVSSRTRYVAVIPAG
ncbi:hypothetical protein Plhal304r1_c005g0022071 [Plasmopara halstedii]